MKNLSLKETIALRKKVLTNLLAERNAGLRNEYTKKLMEIDNEIKEFTSAIARQSDNQIGNYEIHP